MTRTHEVLVNRIKPLPSDLINQIAAGEVVEMPASVVKELVENSIDAGATKIEIETAQGGRYIRVSDNGSGIYHEDIPYLFERHATSKISSQDDLWNIGSLGFRGEAVASIASIAKVLCITRTREDDNGFKASCSEGNITTTETGCAVGTTFEIDDLFYNTPARLKFMKKPETEVAYIKDVIESIALSRPDISFTFIYKGMTKLSTSGSGLLIKTISELYPQVPVKDLVEISAIDEGSDLALSGYTSLPHYTRGNKKTLLTFVNGRYIQSDCMFLAIKKIYADLIPHGRFPFIVVNLAVPRNQLDVNVHPTKKEVKFSDPNQVFRFLTFAFGKTLSVHHTETFPLSVQDPLPMMAAYTEELMTPDFQMVDSAKVNLSADNLLERLKNKTVTPSTSNQELNRTPSVTDQNCQKDEEQEKKQVVSADHSSMPLLESGIQEKIPSLECTEKGPVSSGFKVLGQLFKTYILVERKEGLQIIDQHIAAERYLYEKFLKNYQQNIPVQTLITSEVMDLTESHMAILRDHKDLLKKSGFEIRELSSRTMNLATIPQLLAGKDSVKLVHGLIEELQSGGFEEKTDRIIATIACHAAVRSGDVLTILDMEKIVREWESCEYTYTCPHGRVISSLMPIKSIASLFQRLSHSAR